VARYGPRHLRQLVAIKRLQAQGLALAQIQARLTGATDAVLEQVAQKRTEFWARRPVPESRPGLDKVDDTVTMVYGLELSGLTLLLRAEPATHDLPDIAAAARPLLDLLTSRGLLDPTEGTR
jgi:hypothetical protein